MNGLEKIERRMKKAARRKELTVAKRESAQTPCPCALPAAYSASSALSRAVNSADKYLPETSEPSSVNRYQWEETTNSLGYSNIAKVFHEEHLSQLYDDFVKDLPPFLQHSFIKRMQAKS